jgi:hypothetical protein
MPDREMRRHRQAFYAERALDILVPEVPEIIKNNREKQSNDR